MGGTLGVTGATSLNSTLDVTGATNINNTLTVTNEVSFDSSLNVTDITTLEGATTINNTLKVTDDAEFDNQITCAFITTTSDRRVKTNVVEIEDCINKVKQLNVYSYNRTDLVDLHKKHIGLMAQEVENIFPELVETDSNDLKSVNYSAFSAILVNCVKEIHNKYESLENRLNEIEELLKK